MADSGAKLTGPSGLHYNELHSPIAAGRDAELPGPQVTVDKYENGKIYVITLNRPHRMNSMGGTLMPALAEAYTEYRDDRQARVSIITGRGSRAFCTGADLIETAEQRQAEAEGRPAPARPVWGPAVRSLYRLSEEYGLWKPTIAAINGFAVGGGLMLAMQCDIRIAAEHAKIAASTVRWNMGDGSWLAPLTRQLGLGIALELGLWADTQFTAQRAYEVGWVNKVVPADKLMETAMEYAQRALDMAPRAVRNLKQAFYRGYYMTPDVAAAFGGALDQNLHGMKDSIEGPAAFAEKRRPNFVDS